MLGIVAHTLAISYLQEEGPVQHSEALSLQKALVEVNEVVQWVKVPAAKPDDPVEPPEPTQMWKERIVSLKLLLDYCFKLCNVFLTFTFT